MTDEEIIQEVVSEWVGQGKMFTAYEVTIAARERGMAKRHKAVRAYVHEIIFNEGIPHNYTRILMDVGATEQAWLYYRLGDNPYAYAPLSRKNSASQVPAIAVQGVPLSNMTNPAAVPPGAFGTDGRGRLCIPVALLTAMGVKAKDRVNVIANFQDETLVVTKATGGWTSQWCSVNSYTAESDGNVRLTQATLEKANIGGLQCYCITGNDTEITICKL